MTKGLYYIGVDVGGTFTKIALVSKAGRVVARRLLETNAHRKNKLINDIVNSITGLISNKDLKRKDIAGIGMGLPGLIDSKFGIVRYLVNIKGWRNVHLKKIVENRLKTKTFIDNDVNLMTLGELYHGAGRGARNLVCITLGTGVGGGIVINGGLYRGANLAAGEIGHIPINEEGPGCNCGGSACIESYIGNRYLMRELRKDLKRTKSLIKDLMRKKKAKLTFELVDKAARMGDRFAIQFWKDVGTKLGIALAGVINFLNPEKIVIGGGIANAGRFIFSPLKKTVRKRTMRIQQRTLKIVKAKLGEDAGVIGAAVLARLHERRKRRSILL